MKDLDKLIKLHKWRLDERRVQLKKMEEEMSGLQFKLSAFDQEFASEQQHFAEHLVENVTVVDYGMFDKYQQAAKQKRAALIDEISNLERQLVSLMDEMRDIFEELKKYELTNEQFELEERKKINKLSQDELDEIALNMFRKKS
jgi:flagellar protein FliJ